MRILLVEDEEKMGEALSELLRLEGYQVKLCTDGVSGDEEATGDLYDMMILDVMLPGRSGLEIARHVRKCGIQAPILMLTAKGETEDKIRGLDSGADDYLTKPFEMEELFARLRAMSRRLGNREEKLLVYKDLVLDTETFMLKCESVSREVRLSDKEFRIMEYLIVNQNRIIKKEQLSVRIWGYEDEAEYNKVEVYISFVRKKLAFIHSGVEIKAVRGFGYELRG